MKASGELVPWEVTGEQLLIPVGKTALRLHGMISVSETGLLIWNMLQQECTEDDLVAAIMKEYDGDEETVRADVNEFLASLDALELLER